MQRSDTFAGGQPTDPKAPAHPAPLPLARVPFRGGFILAAAGPVDQEGNRLVPLRPFCERLGLDPDTQARKLRGKAWTCPVIMTVQIPGDDQTRDVLCIPLRALPMWLATINPRKVAPEARPMLEAFQAEACDVLYRHFLAPPSDDMPSARWRRSIETWLARLERKCSKNEARETKGARIRRLEAENARLREAVAALPERCA